jgi:hypothetical protein
MYRTFDAVGILALSLWVAVCSSAAFAAQDLTATTVDGRDVVYDANQNVTWLADANFAASPDGQAVLKAAHITSVAPSGIMDYPTALRFVQAMNTIPCCRSRRVSNGTLLSKPIIGIADCWACAGSGHPTAALPRSMMNSRRLIDRSAFGTPSSQGWIAAYRIGRNYSAGIDGIL